MGFSQSNEQPKIPEDHEESGAFGKREKKKESRKLTEEERKAKALTLELAEAKQDMRDQEKLAKESEQTSAIELVNLTDKKASEILESSTAASLQTELNAFLSKLKAEEEEKTDEQAPEEGPSSAEGEPTDLA